MPGMTMSIRITSGCSLLDFWMASSPFWAVMQQDRCQIPAAAEAGAGDRLVGSSIRGGTDPAPQFLDFPAPGLGFEALLLRASGRPGRSALPRNDGRARHQLVQPGERLCAVSLEAAVLLRLDDEHSLARDALIAGAQKP